MNTLNSITILVCIINIYFSIKLASKLFNNSEIIPEHQSTEFYFQTTEDSIELIIDHIATQTINITTPFDELRLIPYDGGEYLITSKKCKYNIGMYSINDTKKLVKRILNSSIPDTNNTSFNLQHLYQLYIEEVIWN